MMLWKAIFFVLILLSSVSIIPLTFAQVAPVAIYQSPKKQHEQGLLTYEVRCNYGLVLMEKKSDGSPACVKEQTTQKLYQRGWGDFMASPEVLNSSTSEQNSSLPNVIKVSNANFTIYYDITGGKVTKIIQDKESKSFIISVQTTSDGKLTIKVPRAFYDAKMPNGNDDQFFILSDGQGTTFTETKTSTDRTVTIPFTDGTQQIEFIGTWIVSGH